METPKTLRKCCRGARLHPRWPPGGLERATHGRPDRLGGFQLLKGFAEGMWMPVFDCFLAMLLFSLRFRSCARNYYVSSDLCLLSPHYALMSKYSPPVLWALDPSALWLLRDHTHMYYFWISCCWICRFTLCACGTMQIWMCPCSLRISVFFSFLQWNIDEMVISPWCGPAVFLPPPLSLAASSLIQSQNRLSSPSSAKSVCASPRLPMTHFNHFHPLLLSFSCLFFFNLTIEKPL